MTDEGVRFLCTGDLHLGRHPTRLPPRVDQSAVSTRNAWIRIAEEAVRQSVDAVLVSGDIGDRANRYFEIFGAFESGISILEDAEIPVVVVAGNHDAEFLSRMAQDLKTEVLNLLGEDGTWDRFHLETDAGVEIQIDGWSFPRQNVGSSPITDYSNGDVDDPHLGLLHADLDATDSTHAPVRLSELEGAPVDCWILGHIHEPAIIRERDPLVFYPGSPQPLDPGEPGRHGPWLLSWGEGTGWEVEQLPQATARYQKLTVDVDGIEAAETAIATVSEQISTTLEDIEGRDHLEIFVPRIELTGRTPVHSDLLDQEGEMAEQFDRREDGIHIAIDRINVATQPALDLEELAEESGPIGYLAELIGVLEAGKIKEEFPELYQGAKSRVEHAQRTATYTPLRREERLDIGDPSLVETYLEQETKRLIDELIDQKGDPT